MTRQRKDQVVALLKSIETGEEAPTRVVNPNQYIQHNPQTAEGGEGLAVLFKRLSSTSPSVNIVRIFSDGDYVFGHTKYDFSSSRVAWRFFGLKETMPLSTGIIFKPEKDQTLWGIRW